MRRKVLSGLTGLLAGGLAYDYVYRKQNTWPIERSRQAKIASEISNQVDWVYEDHFAKEMWSNVHPYLDSLTEEGFAPVTQPETAYKLALVNTDRPTLVIVHGFLEFKENMTELVYYFTQAGYNVLSYDLHGHGDSKNQDHNLVDIHDFSSFIEDLRALIFYIQKVYSLTDQFYLFGNSMGGAVVTGFMEKWPKIAKGAILSVPMLSINTSPLPQSLAFAGSDIIHHTGLGKLPLPPLGSNAAIFDADNNGALGSSPQRLDYYSNKKSKLYDSTPDNGSLNWLNTAMNAMNTFNQPEHLKKIKPPVLIIQAENDEIVREAALHHAASTIAQAEHIIIPNSSHLIYHETDQVVHAYTTEILHFLDKQALQ